jgi:hypothetical protein
LVILGGVLVGVGTLGNYLVSWAELDNGGRYGFIPFAGPFVAMAEAAEPSSRLVPREVLLRGSLAPVPILGPGRAGLGFAGTF